ncbi:hypothetical protein [Tautonia plasticadhaerens]|uniref:Uncharacterized protein n=1 Tax=Tautonia plasticadhaerens TaxID=2527974 RepID=A0A518HEC3_9BACT|nr:hypothetical protein [Tautonia plasticadhaerens]QDV39182.1 hypothetical protein ElP_71460 [Tautonia plasticadhaerens]
MGTTARILVDDDEPNVRLASRTPLKSDRDDRPAQHKLLCNYERSRFGGSAVPIDTGDR